MSGDAGEKESAPLPNVREQTLVVEYCAAFATAWHSDYRVANRRRRKMVTQHWCRTRPDPFAHTWPLVEGWLAAEPNLAARELLTRLTHCCQTSTPPGHSSGPCSDG